MKNIEIDEELYHHIASNTQYIGESASSILRRLLSIQVSSASVTAVNKVTSTTVDVMQNNPSEEIEKIEDKNVDVTRHPVNETEVNISVDESSDVISAVDGSVYDYINKEELAVQRGAVGRFLLILAALYRVHQHDFSNVCDIRGRDRLYFADNEAVLDASGSSTKPRKIPESPYWVITNSNTTRKKMMLTEVAISLGYSAEEAEEIRDLL